jgi:molybdopterin synthase sulfur carrier subunit
MKVKLLYFARLREALGVDREEIELPEHVRDVASLAAWLRSREDAFDKALAPASQVRVAVDHEMAEPRTPISDGAEIAFFPPVTGGAK